MKHKRSTVYILLIICLAFTFVSYEVGAKSHFRFRRRTTERNVILIDPGHGGIDGGAVSKRGTVEKDINLAISLELKGKLEKSGYKVEMTRDKDVGLYSDKGTIRQKKHEDLNNRCKMKKDSGCNIFISIHMNMFPQSKYYGAQVWYSENDKSKMLARIIQDNLKSDIHNDNKRVEKCAKDDYKVLRNSDNSMAAVLVECGFLSNEHEENQLKDNKFQKQLADSISKSVQMYIDGKY